MAVLLGAAGFLINLWPVPLSPGTNLVFGGVAYLLAAAAFGPGPGLLAGATPRCALSGSGNIPTPG